MRAYRRGLTLIELLVVVAIISILAAVAVPNLLLAQTRAKCSRAAADLRTLATAMEAYRADQGAYPFDLDSRGFPWEATDVLSTPVGYITSVSIPDPFRKDPGDRASQRYRYVFFQANVDPGWDASWTPGPYYARTDFWINTISDATCDQARRLWGEWKLSSSGPDREPNNALFTNPLTYDPANGTVSPGDIIRSQRLPGQR